VCLLMILGLQGCLYSFRAGSFPGHIRSIAILPFDNQTTRLELTQELHDVLLPNLPRSLGIRPGGEATADAVVRGRITGYALTTPSYRPGQDDRTEVLQRQVTVSVSVEIIDLVRNEILWESRALTGEGQFLDASETEDVGLRVAIALLVQRIVDGAQSNW